MKQIGAAMIHPAKLLTAVCAGLSVLALAAGDARAQLAQGKGPIDITGDSSEVIDTQHLWIWKGNVEVIQNGSRLVCDQLNVYYTGSAAQAAGGLPATPAKAPAAAAAADGAGGAPQVQKLVAEGHVFYVSPERSARSDHMVYEATPDTITMTGDVVVVQNGQNVIYTDTLVLDVKTNNAQFISSAQGRNRPDRTRAILYNSANNPLGTSGAAAPKAAAGAPASKP